VTEYALEVRDHIMIAHSLPGDFFGPAQQMHGATFVVDLTLFAPALNRWNVVADIGAASTLLRSVLGPLNYKNLDEVPELKGKLTTTEFLCRYIFDGVKQGVAAGGLGDDGASLLRIRVTLHESHVARAWFEGPAA
jgi:6-pyruvoyl-tetrahydropterin synthase